MKIVILCQALLAFATLTAALPTPLQPTPTPDTQLPGLDFPDSEASDSEMELLNSDISQAQSDENQRPLENPDLFEGDIIISPEEIELYYGKQKNTHVRLKTYTSLTYSLLCGEIHIQIQTFIFNSRLIGQLVVSEETENIVGQMELFTMTSIHHFRIPHIQ